MMGLQAATDAAKDMFEKGELPNRDAIHVEIIRMMGVQLVSGSLTAQVRRALNAAVKAKRLGRLPKDGLRPEAYFHPNAEDHAKEMRNRVYRESAEAIQKVTGRDWAAEEAAVIANGGHQQ